MPVRRSNHPDSRPRPFSISLLSTIVLGMYEATPATLISPSILTFHALIGRSGFGVKTSSRTIVAVYDRLSFPAINKRPAVIDRFYRIGLLVVVNGESRQPYQRSDAFQKRVREGKRNRVG